MSDMTTSPVVAVSEPQPIKTVVMTLPENPQGFRLSSEQCCNRYRVKPGMTIFKYRHAGPRAGIHCTAATIKFSKHDQFGSDEVFKQYGFSHHDGPH